MGLFSTNNRNQAINAAKVPPSQRSTTEQGRVSRSSGQQVVRNADFAAQQEERVWGKGGNPHKKK